MRIFDETNNMQNTKDVTSRYSTVDCFHFRLELACPSLFSLSWNLTDFIAEYINSLQWENPQVSVQLVDK